MSSKKTKFEPMLAHNYTDQVDPTGWILSEKLDGVRAIWNTKDFISRRHHKFNSPKWFSDVMPKDIWLDGELFTKRGDFNRVSGIVRKKIPVDTEWEHVTYNAFDLPKSTKPYTERIKDLDTLIKNVCNTTKWVGRECPLKSVKTYNVKSKDDMIKKTSEITSQGGEGSIIRDPDSLYFHGRSKSMLKVKDFNDDDAIVLGHLLGTGRNSKRLGSLVCAFVTAPSIRFNVGSGFTDDQRDQYKKEFPLGSIIRVKYFELSPKGVPRMPVFMGVHIDR